MSLSALEGEGLSYLIFISLVLTLCQRHLEVVLIRCTECEQPRGSWDGPRYTSSRVVEVQPRAIFCSSWCLLGNQHPPPTPNSPTSTSCFFLSQLNTFFKLYLLCRSHCRPTFSSFIFWYSLCSNLSTCLLPLSPSFLIWYSLFVALLYREILDVYAKKVLY